MRIEQIPVSRGVTRDFPDEYWKEGRKNREKDFEKERRESEKRREEARREEEKYLEKGYRENEKKLEKAGREIEKHFKGEGGGKDKREEVTNKKPCLKNVRSEIIFIISSLTF